MELSPDALTGGGQGTYERKDFYTNLIKGHTGGNGGTNGGSGYQGIVYIRIPEEQAA